MWKLLKPYLAGVIYFSVVALGAYNIGILHQTKNQLQQQVVGKTPEGFHRADALQFCEALEEANVSFTCVDPYTLPNYSER